MSKRVLSIEIGNSLTKICEMDYMVKKPKVYAALTVRTPKDAYADGMLKPSEDFANAIIHGLAGKGIKTKDAVFSISSTKIASREVQIPNVKTERIEGIVKANAGDYFPIDMSQYEIGYHMTGAAPVDDKLKVMALAVPKSLLNNYYDLASACGLTIKAFDYSSNSLYQVLKDAMGEETTLILKVDEISTVATIMQAGQIIMQRNVAYGVETAIETLMANKVFDAFDYNAAVNRLRRKTCINRTLRPEDAEWDMSDEPEEEESEALTRAKQNVTLSLGNLISSIGRVLDYYNSRNNGNPVQKIYLTGFGGDFSGLSKLLSNCLEQKVVVLSSVDGVAFGRNMKDVSFGEYISCLGAVVAPVGLMNDATKAAANVTLVKGTNYTFVSVSILMLGIVGALALSILSVGRYTAAEAENVSLKARIQSLQEAQQVYDVYMAAKAQNDKYEFFYEYTETPNENLVAFINELEEILPSSFYTNSFTSDESGISMTVTVEGKPAAARVIKNIRDMESIENVSVSGITEAEDDLGASQVTFSIMGTYRDIHAAQEQADAGQTAQTDAGQTAQ